MEFEINSKSCIFEWGIFEIGCMPLRRIYLGLVSLPKKIWGGLTREEMLKMAKNVKNGQNKAQRYVQLSSKKNSKSCIFEWGIFEIGCMPLCRILLGLVSQPK